MRAALWGVALGCLAPATTALVIQSGLGARGVSFPGDLDVRFFFLYLPVAMAVAATLQSLRPDTYRRNLAVAVTVIGAAALVKLRIHGESVTDSAWRDAWLTVNGSLVLHVIAVWALLRVAVADLARFPGALSPASDGDTAIGDRRDLALLGLGLHGVLWGVIIGATAGGAVGTVLIPGAGTISGAYLGALYGLVPTAVGAVGLVAFVAWRHDVDVAGLRDAVGMALAVVCAGTMAWAWPFLTTLVRESRWDGLPVLPLWLLVAGVVWPLLGVAVERLANTYVRLSLGRRQAEAGDRAVGGAHDEAAPVDDRPARDGGVELVRPQR